LIVTRRVFAAALSLAGVALFAPLHPISEAMAQSTTAALVAKPVSLPDMAIGSIEAPVTITEYASMSCPHCAVFGENVFPMLRSKYIDTGKVRFVFASSRSISRLRPLRCWRAASPTTMPRNI
jgi:protein-disulfide isomerase